MSRKDKKYIPKIAGLREDEEDEETQITADFIQMQHITPPAIHDNSNQDHSTRIGIGRASKISQLMKDPYRHKPKSMRSRTRDKKKSKILANFPEIKKEIDKESLKAQEKLITDANIKPLINKGIKVNNFRTIYPR